MKGRPACCCDGDKLSPLLVATSSVENAVFSQNAGNNATKDDVNDVDDRLARVSGLSLTVESDTQTHLHLAIDDSCIHRHPRLLLSSIFKAVFLSFFFLFLSSLYSSSYTLQYVITICWRSSSWRGRRLIQLSIFFFLCECCVRCSMCR